MKNYKFRHFIQMTVLFLFLLTLVITLTIQGYPLYHYAINKYHLPEVTGLSKGLLLKNYHILIQYLSIPTIKVLNMPNFPSSPSGLAHFYDVKKLFLLNYGIFIVTLIPAVIILKNYFKQQRFFELKNFFKVGSLIPILLGLTMALGFDQFFVAFHKVLFNNNDWLFDPNVDPVILALPEEFFRLCFIFFFVVFEGLMVIGFIVSALKDKKHNI